MVNLTFKNEFAKICCFTESLHVTSGREALRTESTRLNTANDNITAIFALSQDDLIYLILMELDSFGGTGTKSIPDECLYVCLSVCLPACLNVRP